MQEVHGADEVADPPSGVPGVHGQGAADRGGDADQALDAAQVDRRRLADQRGEAYAGAGDRPPRRGTRRGRGSPRASGRRRARRGPAPASCCRRRSRATGSCSRSANISACRMSSTSCGTTKMSGGAADAERGVEAQGLLEPHFASDLSQHAGLLSRSRRVRAWPGASAAPGRAVPTSPAPSVSTRSPRRTISQRDARRCAARSLPRYSDVAMAVRAAIPSARSRRVDTGDRRLAGRIDVDHDQHVGLVERA